MDDEEFKKNYQKYKYRVKEWEHNFKKKNKRIPSKLDIQEAPTEIRASYKLYFKMKTQLLDQTLSGIFEDDGFNILDNSNEIDPSIIDDDNKNGINISGINLDNLVIASNSNEFSNLREIKDSQKDINNLTNLDDNHVIKQFEPKEVSKQNETAWGDNLNKKSDIPLKKPKSPTKSSSLKPNGNMQMKSLSFSIRNPRKSISRQSSGMSQGSNLSQKLGLSQEILPDLETILSQKAKEQIEVPAIPSALTTLQKTKEVLTEIDIGWLNRTSSENGLNVNNNDIKRRILEKPKTYGLGNIDLDKLKRLTTTSVKDTLVDQTYTKVDEISEYFPPNNKESDDDVEEVVAESENEEDVNRQPAKRRRVMPLGTNSVIVDIVKQQDSDVIKYETTFNEYITPKPTIRKRQKRKRACSESLSDENKGSDCETDSKPPRKLKSKIRKTEVRKGLQNGIKVRRVKKEKPQTYKTLPPNKTRRVIIRKNRAVKNETLPEDEDQPEEYILPFDTTTVKVLPRMPLEDLKTLDEAANSYVSRVVGLSSITSKKTNNKTIENEKSVLARSKLEEKMKSGKLNENFVTVNLRKKVFVKGKKPMNFSKYKKGLWKQKKAASLCGPDMDMRGCDGGILTCFQCGMPGHFSQDCKVKGDRLLPSNAELDDASPFPTLEEAQKLAAQNAVLVHSKNIQKLPEAVNTNIFDNKESEDDKKDNKDFETDTKIDDLGKHEEYLNNMDGIDSDEFDTVFEEENVIEVSNAALVPEDFLKKAGLLEVAENNASIGAVYDLNDDGTVKKPTEEVYEVLKMFGHTDFRKGQERAVMRILSGQSTLVTLSTGSGKSLCYQLPAYLYSKHKGSITLVISPLVSLMEDQVHGIPGFLRAYCLHTGQPKPKQLAILEMIQRGEIDILLLSPEAVVAGEKSTGFGSILRNLPPIAFACIDEVHCVSQWSHNFRPSYLMICKVLQQNLKVNTILGLTATATLPTRTSIIRHLRIHDGEEGIISDIPLPDNLILSVSKDVRKDDALLNLLRSERFRICTSIIIYCTRRDECEKVAANLRSLLPQAEQPKSMSKRKRVVFQAEAYHAGLASSKRQAIQNRFMRNELKIVVATIAFGMGINKSDIRGVIHYNMPKNFESYVQEVGRAGRDGKISHCHLFLDHHKGDQNELRRHIFANSIDRHVIRKLLNKIFIPCSCIQNITKTDFIKEHENEIKAAQIINCAEFVDCELTKSKPRPHVCPGHEIGFSIDHTVQELDIPSENISTLLCYLELDSRWCLNVLSQAYIMCKVISYGGPKHLKQAARNSPPLAAAIALLTKKGIFDERSNVIEFSIVDISAAIGWNSGVVKYQMKNLEWTTNENGLPKRSPISVTYYDLGFRVKVPGDFDTDEREDALISLYGRAVEQEKAQLRQLQYVYKGLTEVSNNSCLACAKVDDTVIEKSSKLKKTIRSYFKHDCPQDIEVEITLEEHVINEIASNVRSLINMYPENNFTGRAVARIFHGIQSPKFPAVIWSRCKFWRKNMEYDFNSVVKIANGIIVNMRSN